MTALRERHIIVVGGGAAGFFAAIHCAAATPGCRLTILEKGPQFLTKVRISGGGRCNVTHACFEPRELARRYPRGGSALIGPFHRFQPADTMAWFEDRGVPLKIERDGRVFPVSDSSQTIIDCLLRAARTAGVEARLNCGVAGVSRRAGLGFVLTLGGGERLECDGLLLATGGCRSAAHAQIAVALGHTLETPVPSLFTFHLATPWLTPLAGVSVDPVEALVPGTGLCERGPILITHRGLSGPVILRLSAWGARSLHASGYRFTLRLNWLPEMPPDTLTETFNGRRDTQGPRLVVNSPIAPLTARLWEQLVLAAGVRRETRWSELSRAARQELVRQLASTELPVAGKSLNQDEFVTCGGVRLSEVDFKTLQSRICPGLYFAGELLDIDGLTGGFNFQAAWTTGWIAGRAMAEL